MSSDKRVSTTKQGSLWTESDRKLLLNSVHSPDDDYVSISKQLGRSQKAVYCQLRQIAYNMVMNEHVTIQSASDRVKIHVAELQAWADVKAAEARYDLESSRHGDLNNVVQSLQKTDEMVKILSNTTQSTENKLENLASSVNALQNSFQQFLNQQNNSSHRKIRRIT